LAATLKQDGYDPWDGIGMTIKPGT